MSHMSESSSFLENFGVPEDLGYTSHSSDMRENSHFNPSGKDIYNKRKTFQKKASLKEDVSEYHVEVISFLLSKLSMLNLYFL